MNYRSGWELQFAQWLDASPQVKSFRYEPYVIEYISNQRTLRHRKYWPDFEVTYVDGRVELIEIKPKRKLTQITNIKKFAAAHAFCQTRNLSFKVVTEIDLKTLGLLK